MLLCVVSLHAALCSFSPCYIVTHHVISPSIITVYDFFIIKCSIDSMNGESDGADRIFLGGVPYYFSEAQMKELLESFGYVFHIFFQWGH